MCIYMYVGAYFVLRVQRYDVFSNCAIPKNRGFAEYLKMGSGKEWGFQEKERKHMKIKKGTL